MKKQAYRTTLLASICLAWMSLAAPAQAQVVNIVSDNFTGASATQNWAVLGSACLTAGNNTGSIPACTSGKDSVGKGALRLTSASSDQHGAIISNWTFPSDQGIQVTYTTYTYGGNSYNPNPFNGSVAPTGADGIGFYLLNGTAAPNIGAFGGSLGYSCSNDNSPADGMAGAYLGVGMDEFGNFSNGGQDQWGNTGDNTATGTGNPGYQNPNEIAVRGWGNVNAASLKAISGSSVSTSTVQSVCLNGGSYQGQTLPDYPLLGYYNLPSSEPIANEGASSLSSATPITYKLIITPSQKLSLSYEYGSASTFTSIMNNVDISANNGPLPPSFRFGFGASTGGGTNVHEITCFAVQPANEAIGAPVAPLSITGSNLVYTLNSGLDPIAGHVDAFATNASGVPAATPSWDAASLMTAAQRTSDLYSTSSDNATVVPFGNLDAAAFDVAVTTTTQKVQTGTQQVQTGWKKVQTGTQTVCVKYYWWGGGCKKWKKKPVYTNEPVYTTVPVYSTVTVSAPTNTCLGTTEAQADANIIAFTQDPSYTWSAMPTTCPSYLGARQQNWYLGEFSANDFAALMTPPSDAYDLGIAGYVSYASSEAKRAQALLFTNNDGFLYSVNASTGAFNWGWMPRIFAAQLQNYSQVPEQGLFDGKFRIVDAADASGKWATYVIGSAEGGAYWYDLKLDANGNPSSVVTLPAMPVGSVYPQRQAPVVANVNGQQIAAFIANVGSGATGTSTLYEYNVATGVMNSTAFTSSEISGMVSSNMFYDPQSGQLYFGSANGDIYVTSLTGTSKTDASNVTQLGVTQDGNPVAYLGYQLDNGEPYLWAASSTGLTVYGVGSSGWQPLWATTQTSGYVMSSGSWVTSTDVPALQSPTAIISDMPVLASNVLIVPTYVPPSGTSAACGGLGEGYYDFFNLTSGKFPSNEIINETTGKYVTTNEDVGQGIAYSPSVSISSTGLPVFGGTQATVNPITPLMFSKTGVDTVTQWREH